MNCPSCGAAMHLKPDMVTFKCDYCQSVYAPAPSDEGVTVLGEPCDQQCPLCSTALVHATVSSTRIRYCTKCKGMLVPMGIVAVLVNDIRSDLPSTVIPPPADTTELKRKIACPQCHRTMEAHFYAGPGHTIIDSCEHCASIWLDGGELMRIARASGGESQLPTTTPMPGDTGWIGETGSVTMTESVADTLFDSVIRSILN